jgi:hypothetical protein
MSDPAAEPAPSRSLHRAIQCRRLSLREIEALQQWYLQHPEFAQ